MPSTSIWRKVRFLAQPWALWKLIRLWGCMDVKVFTGWFCHNTPNAKRSVYISILVAFPCHDFSSTQLKSTSNTWSCREMGSGWICCFTTCSQWSSKKTHTTVILFHFILWNYFKFQYKQGMYKHKQFTLYSIRLK